ncbi:MAG: hypothetical protein C5B50_21425 [Verrucomicrobia bacterium]|nr:MAG: hypothetical protein C5B50_21425 [Verrucomicrobiota bacterium]
MVKRTGKLEYWNDGMLESSNAELIMRTPHLAWHAKALERAMHWRTVRPFHHSIIPLFHYSTRFHHSIIPIFHCCIIP